MDRKDGPRYSRPVTQLSLRLALASLAFALFAGVFAVGCSSDAEATPAPSDAGPTVEAGKPKVDAGPVEAGPLHPTPRCANPKPATGFYLAATDAGAPDAALDSGEPDAAAEDGGDADAGAPTDAGIDSAPHGLAPATGRPPHMPHQGGPVLAAPRWVPIFFRDTEDQPDIEDFLGSIGCTDYWRAIASDFGVGEGISSPSVVVPEDGPARIEDEQIKKWLSKQIQAGLVEPPSKDILYVLFYPSTTNIYLGSDRSCRSFGGYHSEGLAPDGTPIPYAVIPNCRRFEDLTSTTSHELIEATSDPFPFSAPAFSAPSKDDLAWAYLGGGENSDLCSQRFDAQYTPSDYPYAVQRSFSNKSSLEGHDPCVPTDGPYFYAAPWLEDTIDLSQLGAENGKGVLVPPGTSRIIDVTLGADQPIGVFRIEVLSGDQGFGQQLPGSGTTFSLDQATGKPGDHLKLTITAPPSASEPDVFALVARYQGKSRPYFGIVGH